MPYDKQKGLRVPAVEQVHRTGIDIGRPEVLSWELAGAHQSVCKGCRQWRRLGLDKCNARSLGIPTVCHA